MELLASDEPVGMRTPFLPHATQHIILNATQRILEEIFYEFVSAHMPLIILHRGWHCSIAVELTEWIRIFRRVDYNLSGAMRLGFEEHLRDLSNLRNVAVHRRPISKNHTDQLLLSALQVANLLQDQLDSGRKWAVAKLQE